MEQIGRYVDKVKIRELFIMAISVDAANGMIVNLYGSGEGRSHDAVILGRIATQVRVVW